MTLEEKRAEIYDFLGKDCSFQFPHDRLRRQFSRLVKEYGALASGIVGGSAPELVKAIVNDQIATAKKKVVVQKSTSKLIPRELCITRGYHDYEDGIRTYHS